MAGCCDMDVDAAVLIEPQRYKLMAGLVVPRPIAWVTTLHADDVVNLAPFSFFQVMSTRVGYVGLGIQDHDDGRIKDTLLGIRGRGEFVVNLSTVSQAQQVERSSADMPAGVSEVDRLGLETAPSVQVSVPRLAEAPGALECRLEQVITLSDSESWVIGRVLHIHVADALLQPGLHVDFSAYRPLGRLVGHQYVDTREMFSLRENS